MDRPFQEVLLPISKLKAEVYTYYLRGEKKAIEAIMLSSAEYEKDNDGKIRLKSLNASYRSEMEDKSVLFAVKSLKDEAGNEIPVKIESLDGLPDDDFKILKDSLPTPKKK